MISILNRITSRARKLLILMIVLPLVTGVAAAYMEAKKGTTYTGKASIWLGNFDLVTNYKMPLNNDPGSAIKTDYTLNGIKESSGGNFNVDDVKAKLVVTPGTTSIGFQYTGNNKKQVKEIISDLANGFVKSHNKLYDERMKKLNNRLTFFANYKTGVDSATRLQVLNDIQSQLDTLQPDYVADGPSIEPSYSNPFKRAIFGLILGLMLDIVITVIPEFFREYR